MGFVVLRVRLRGLGLRASGFGFRVQGFVLNAMALSPRLGFRVYLSPEEPTFLGFLLMISLYKSLKR